MQIYFQSGEKSYKIMIDYYYYTRFTLKMSTFSSDHRTLGRKKKVSVLTDFVVISSSVKIKSLSSLCHYEQFLKRVENQRKIQSSSTW